MTATETVRRSRILLVDDDPTVLLLGRQTLEQSGFHVFEAVNGSEGFSVFSDIRPDLVILDVNMPAMGGYEVCRLIRSHFTGRDIPVLMMTGWNDIDSIKKAFDAGATDFLTKPVNWLVLPHRVRYMLRASDALISLSNNEARLLHAQRLARLGSWEWDLQADSLVLSEEAYRLFDAPQADLHAGYRAFLNSLPVHGASAAGTECSPQQVRVDHQLILSDGRIQYVTTEAELFFDREDRASRLIGTIQDITDRKHAEDKIRFLAYYDSLTSLPNRSLFLERVELALNERHGKKVAILFVDLDRFKNINDSLGHTVGDKLLQSVAARLRKAVRRHDTVSRRALEPEDDDKMIARLGGDEFTILLEYFSSALDASKVAVRILDELNAPFFIGGSEIFVTASIGISVWPDDCSDADSLIKNADMAMYHAKDKGRNNFQYFDESMNRAALQRLKLETSLRRALTRGEFTLYYQPKISLPDNRIYGVEALVRWESPELGWVSPGTFIPLAEESSLITAIDDWVLEAACRQLQQWDTLGLSDIIIAVNISGRDILQHGRLIERTRELIEKFGIVPKNLEFEITEGVLMDNAEIAIKTFSTLRDIGISLSVDDFGTGYSSLSYLRHFPITTLKIDQSFVREVTREDGAAAIVKAIITLAQNLNIHLVAEGVETREQMELLLALGCTEMQGYFLGFPAPADDITRLLINQRSCGTSAAAL